MISIPFKRGDKRQQLRALIDMEKALEKGKMIILFAEGTRTFRFDPKELLHSKTGKEMGPFKNGVGILLKRVKGLKILPLWVENTDVVMPNSPDKLFAGINIRGKRVVIKVGKLTRIRNIGSVEEITRRVEQILLDLADEE